VKHFLRKLIAGIDTAFLSSQEQTYLATLDAQYLRTDEGKIRFNSKFKPGIIKERKDQSKLFIPLDETDPISLDSTMTMHAQKEDIVLVQRIMGRSRYGSAKVVAILDKETTYSVGIIQSHILVELVTKTPLKHDQDVAWLTAQKEGELFLIDNKNNTLLRPLGHIDDPLVDEAIALALYNRSEAFGSAVLDEVKAFGREVREEEKVGRVDLRALDFVTIDPVTAKDFDDAIYFDTARHTLYVAIADVSHYVVEESAIDMTAYTRGFSVYFPHKSIPMLPRELSENLCSLNPHVDRLSFVFEMPIDTTTLEVHNAKVYEAVIHSKRRFNYEEVDALLEGAAPKDANDAHQLVMLRALQASMDRVRAKRLLTGYTFRAPEIGMNLDAQQLLESTVTAQETPSHALIEDCMLLANIQAAKSFEQGLYRVHEAPSLAKLDTLYHQLALIGLKFKLTANLKETITSIQKAAQEMHLEHQIDTLLIQTQMQAHYASLNVGHFGLGFGIYTHFTSPIRRYSDLVVHRIIKATLAHEERHLAKLLQPIDATAIDISHKEREADHVAKNFAYRKYARWAHARIDQTIEAMIIAIDEAPKALSISPIDAMPIELDSVPLDIGLFDKVVVRILGADYTTNRIWGSVVEKCIDEAV